ncbi:MAG: N-acetylmuramoyl-L-alanine amidase [bacterium]
MTSYRLRLCALLFLLPLYVSICQQLNLTLQIEQQQPARVRTLARFQVLYLAVNDVAAALAPLSTINQERKKFELRLLQHRMKLSANNPFIVVTESESNTSSVFQLSRSVILIDSLYYMPFQPFLYLLQRYSQKPVAYDEAKSLITIGSIPRFEIKDFTVEKKDNGYLLTIQSDKRLGDHNAFLRQDGSLIVTIVDARADTQDFNHRPPMEPITRIVTQQFRTALQLTFKLSSSIAQAEVINDPQSTNLIIDLRKKSETTKVQPAPKKEPAANGKPGEEPQRQLLDVVVIDPGHGGKDPGTVGLSGTYEKVVALAIARIVKEQMTKQMKDVKVHLTRERDDQFVALHERTKMANDWQGKLFISIHCNSTERKPSTANGFEIYLLREGKDEDARRIAEVENSVITLEEGYENRYKELTIEKFMIIKAQQSKFWRYSERFAEIASTTMDEHLSTKNREVKQAGFYVLVGAAMPNVLVETGYLSNRVEEKFLYSAAGQRRIAEALVQSIKKYKQEFELETIENTTDQSRD